MKLVRQPKGSAVCVAACCAMLVGRSLRYVLNRVKLRPAICGKPCNVLTMIDAARFLIDHDMLLFGGAFAFDKPRQIDSTPFDVRIMFGNLNAIVTVPNGPILHCVVFDAATGNILDPLKSEPQQLRDYTVLEWAIVRTYDKKEWGLE